MNFRIAFIAFKEFFARLKVFLYAVWSFLLSMKRKTMNQQTSKMFTLQEAAIAYALSAEKICDGSRDFLNENPCVVPVFVNLLFQSLEISIKAAGIGSTLFTIGEARSRQTRSGYGISELATLAVEKLGGDLLSPL